MEQDEITMKQLIDRFDRLENKIDKMQSALIELARTEERVVQLMEKDARREKIMHEMQERLAVLEKAQIENRSKIGFMWAGLGAAVTACIGLLTAFIRNYI